jgi:hypothetical protein
MIFSRVKIAHSIYFGVACGVTILGNDCIQYGRCELYFGAAAVPRIAAAGAAAWAWVMYAVAFDGVPNGFVSALAMAMVPLAIETKTVMACGDKWRDLLGEVSWMRVAVSHPIPATELQSALIFRVFYQKKKVNKKRIMTRIRNSMIRRKITTLHNPSLNWLCCAGAVKEK